jgi:hypothetical protein
MALQRLTRESKSIRHPDARRKPVMATLPQGVTPGRLRHYLPAPISAYVQSPARKTVTSGLPLGNRVWNTGPVFASGYNSPI